MSRNYDEFVVKNNFTSQSISEVKQYDTRRKYSNGQFIPNETPSSIQSKYPNSKFFDLPQPLSQSSQSSIKDQFHLENLSKSHDRELPGSRDMFTHLTRPNTMSKNNDISLLYGYKYGYEISSPKKISVNYQKDTNTNKIYDKSANDVYNLKEKSLTEFSNLTEFIPFRNFEHFDFLRAESQICKKTFLKKVLNKLKKILN